MEVQIYAQALMQDRKVPSLSPQASKNKNSDFSPISTFIMLVILAACLKVTPLYVFPITTPLSPD